MNDTASSARLAWPLRQEWKQRWEELLGTPDYPLGSYRQAGVRGAEKTAETLCEAPGDGFAVESWLLPTGPQERQKILLLRPQGEGRAKRARHGKLPCVVVPFYEPEVPAGMELESERYGLCRAVTETKERSVRQYGLDLVRQGYLVVCCQAYPYNMVPEPAGETNKLVRWRDAAICLNERYPTWTGLGKLLHDTQCAITFLLQQPDADTSRLAIVGHSLGGKIAFYTGCLDERVHAVIASDFGLPWSSTNWDDAWYLGAKRPGPESDLTHDKLLSLLAPGGFYLIAGEADNEASWEIIEKARPQFAGLPLERLSWHHHASGHDPTPESLHHAYAWLHELMSPRP